MTLYVLWYLSQETKSPLKLQKDSDPIYQVVLLINNQCNIGHFFSIKIYVHAPNFLGWKLGAWTRGRLTEQNLSCDFVLLFFSDCRELMLADVVCHGQRDQKRSSHSQLLRQFWTLAKTTAAGMRGVSLKVKGENVGFRLEEMCLRMCLEPWGAAQNLMEAGALQLLLLSKQEKRNPAQT